MKFYEMFHNWEDVEEYASKSVIFSEGDKEDVMYIILSGDVELTLHGEPLGAEGEGGIIGEMAIISGAPRSATARALNKVRLARVNRDQFTEFVRKDPDFSLHVMAVLANRLRAVDHFIATQFKHLG